jgi:hypothetical protein
MRVVVTLLVDDSMVALDDRVWISLHDTICLDHSDTNLGVRSTGTFTAQNIRKEKSEDIQVESVETNISYKTEGASGSCE